MTLLLTVAFKVSAVLLAALAVSPLLRRQSAALRHWVVATAIAAAAVTPLLVPVVPSWSLAPARQGGSPAPPQVDITTTIATSVAASDAQPVRVAGIPPVARPSLWSVAVAIWIGGAVISLGVLLAGLLRLRRVASTATRLTDGRWVARAQEIAGAYGIRRPVRLLHSSDPSFLMTWGLLRPTIVLPAPAAAWDDDRIRVVLCHELAHIRRADWGVQMVAELLRAAHWFNPLVWIACRRLRHESEQACDDAVLNAGVAGAAYASQLVDLARTLVQHRRAWSPALPVARRSGLERRVHAMLNGSLNRHPVTSSTRIAIAFAFLLITSAAAGAALFAQTAFGTIAGSVADPSGAVLPAVTLSVTNVASEAQTTLRSDREGRFEFVGLPPGDYVIEARLPGFRRHHAVLAVNGERIDREIVMTVATLQETITVTDDDTPRAANPGSQARTTELLAKRASQTCSGAPPDASGPPIGGNIRPPLKLRHVSPVYPPALRDAKVTGVVTMTAVIGLDGSVRDVRVDPSAHPELARAAADAVRDWRFTETLLNCVPIEVEMNVSVSFSSAP